MLSISGFKSIFYSILREQDHKIQAEPGRTINLFAKKKQFSAVPLLLLQEWDTAKVKVCWSTECWSQ